MLRAKTDEPDFLNASMGSEWYQRFLGIGVSGGNGALGNLDKKALEECKIMLPEREERDAIGAFFRDLDDLITLHQRKQTSGHAGQGMSLPGMRYMWPLQALRLHTQNL